MQAAELQHVLEIPISSKAFASMETSLPAAVLQNPYAFFERVRAREGDVIWVEDATVDGVKLPFPGSHQRDRPVYVAMGCDTVRKIVANGKAVHHNYGDHMDVLVGENQLAGITRRSTRYRALVSKAFELTPCPC